MQQKELTPPLAHEIIATVYSTDDLRSARFERAEQTTNGMVRNELNRLDRVTDPDTGIARVPAINSDYDMARVSPLELMTFDGVGIDAAKLVGRLGKGKEEFKLLESVDLVDEHLEVRSYSEGVSLSFKIDGYKSDSMFSARKSDHLTAKIRDRFAASPPYKAVHDLVRGDGIYPKELKTEPFDSREDSLGTLAFLFDNGFTLDTWRIDDILKNGGTFQDAVDDILFHQEYSRATRLETDTTVMLSTGNNVVKTITYDKQSGAMDFSISKKPEKIYPEQANQSSAESIPFIDTKAGHEIYNLLDGCGLMLHPQYEEEMVRMGDAERFGSVYTQISREVAKWVDRPERLKLNNIFVPYDPSIREKLRGTTYGDEAKYTYLSKLEEITREEQAVITDSTRQKILAMDISQMSEPTKVLIGMVQQCLERTDENTESDLPVTNSEIKIEGGSCFDVTSYYVGAAGGRSGLYNIQVNGVNMLEKTHGSHTFMLSEPIRFNGVDLPKGTLMQRGDDDGWAVLRLTPFSFDDPADRLATGSEIAKTELNEAHAIQTIGGTALKNVIAHSTQR